MRIGVSGSGGMVASFLTNRLVAEGHHVVAIDVKPRKDWQQINPYAVSIQADMGVLAEAEKALDGCEWVYALGARMGGIGEITNHRADCAMSTVVTANTLQAAVNVGVERLLYSSSACVYSSVHQESPDAYPLSEDHLYPLDSEEGYGEEKWWGERLCKYFREDYGLETRVARYHNVMSGGPTTWDGGKEKAPAALCRKVAIAELTGDHRVEIWGDGHATRTFCWIDDCVEGTIRLMNSDHHDPLNIGSSELVSINGLVDVIEAAAFGEVGVLERSYDLTAPEGVRGRSSDNTRCLEVLGWEPTTPLAEGIAKLYGWVRSEVAKTRDKKG